MFSGLIKVLRLRSRSQVSSSATPSSRLLRLEPLETRELLSASEIGAPTSALVSEYAPGAPSETEPISLGALYAETGNDLEPSSTTVADAPVLSASSNPTPLEKPVLTVTGATGLSITVSWDAVPNAVRYSLSYKPSNETTWKNVNVGTELNYTVNGLKLDSNYDFRLKAIGDGANYKSVYSDVVGAKTNATPDHSETPIPLDAPIPTVTGKTGTTVTVSWDAVPNAVRYSLSYKPSSETVWTNVNVGTNLSYTMSGLENNAGYDVRAKAIGDGTIYKSVYSAILRAQTTSEIIPLEQPVLTVAATGSTFLTVSWDEVPNAVRYSFSYKLASETTWTNINVGTDLSRTVGGLDLNSEYDVRVKAIGDGVNYKNVYSAILRVKTASELIPLAQPVLTVAAAESTSLTINWSEVPNALRYSFSYKPSSGTTWTNVNVGTNLSYTINGLDLNTDYDVRVKAIGDGVNYKSVYSAIVRVMTTSEQPVPLETPILTVAAVGSTSLTIDWNELPNAARYSFSYKPASETAWTNVNVGTKLSYTVGGLDLNTEYDVRVKAIGDGVSYKSVYSAIVRVETASVHFQLDAGANVENRTLELFAPEGYEIYYTTDGSDPVVSLENLYSEPLALTPSASRLAAASDLINVGNSRIYDNNTLPKAVTVKAVAVAPDGDATPIATRTFFLQEREPVVVISISPDYDNLLNYDTGIMVKGAYYDAWVNTPEAAPIIANKMYWRYQGNYTQKGKNWERPATIEIFDGDNYMVENCGIRLRGDASRMYAQKCFAFYLTEDYGVNGLDYALFDDATTVDGNVVSNYKNFIVRNGGNDTEYLKFHDALIQSLAKNLNFATQASRPAVLYLNGEYMGIYVMQERYDGKFFADHYLVDEDAVVLVQEGLLTGGNETDAALYEELLAYANMDLTDPEVYNAFCDVVDVESMIDYYATEIYIANADWKPEKNTCLWRTRTHENDSFGDGKWRWALYDTEYSSSLYNQTETSYNYDSFTAALNKDPIFAGLINNPVFYQAFVEKIESLAANEFSSTTVNSALNSFSNVYKPYMSNYYKRYGDSSWAWNSNINGIRNFFANRAQYILNYVENYQQ